MARYVAIVWFKNGTKRESGSTDNRGQAERMGAQMFEQATRSAVSDMFKPTRYEVVEKNNDSYFMSESQNETPTTWLVF